MKRGHFFPLTISKNHYPRKCLLRLHLIIWPPACHRMHCYSAVSLAKHSIGGRPCRTQPRDLKSMQIHRLWVIFWGAHGFSTYIVVCLHHWVFDSPHHSTWGTQLWPEHRLLGEHIDSYLAWPSPSKSEPSHRAQLPSDPFSSLQFSRARSISCIRSLRKKLSVLGEDQK